MCQITVFKIRIRICFLQVGKCDFWQYLCYFSPKYDEVSGLCYHNAPNAASTRSLVPCCPLLPSTAVGGCTTAVVWCKA